MKGFRVDEKIEKGERETGRRKVAGKEKEDLLLKLEKVGVVFILMQEWEVWALEKGTVVFLCVTCLRCKLSQVWANIRNPPVYMYMFGLSTWVSIKGKRKMSESKSPGRLKTVPNYIKY